MKDKKKLGVIAQLIMLCAIPMVIMVLVVTFYSIGKMRDLVQEMIHYRNGLPEEAPPYTGKVRGYEERYRAILQKAK